MRRWPVPSFRLFSTTQRSRVALVQKSIQRAPPAAVFAETNPYVILASELARLRHHLVSLLGSAHPALNEVAKYYFLHPSQQLRPLLILLFSRATNGVGTQWESKRWDSQCENAEQLDMPLLCTEVLHDWNPNMPDDAASFDAIFPLHHPIPLPENVPSPLASSIIDSNLLPSQRRLAQIVEMIHVASLLHDDILDSSKSLRKIAAFIPVAVGNKLAVLGGDFLLGRASAALSRLGDSEVVELVASVITNLVEGQIRDLSTRAEGTMTCAEAWDAYLRQTYLKTASLMAKGARASVILGGSMRQEVWKDVAYAYGRNLGIAFQLVEDALEYEATKGKPLIHGRPPTGPLLYAWQDHSEMRRLILDPQPADAELVQQYVDHADGFQRTMDLARRYADSARAALYVLPESDAKVALRVLTEQVVERTW